MVPNPNARVSQLPAEVAWSPVPGGLLSQLPVEVATTVGSVFLADVLSQLPVEVATSIVGNGNPLVTQVVGESVTVNPPLARITQTVPEAVLYPTDEFARTTQSVLEVIYHGQQVTVVIQSACFIAVQTDFPIVAIPST